MTLRLVALAQFRRELKNINFSFLLCAEPSGTAFSTLRPRGLINCILYNDSYLIGGLRTPGSERELEWAAICIEKAFISTLYNWMPASNFVQNDG